MAKPPSLQEEIFDLPGTQSMELLPQASKSVASSDLVGARCAVPDNTFDGGYRAWATLVGGFLASTATFGYTNAFGVYQDVYTREDAASSSNISWIGSTQLFLVLAMSLPAGVLLDKGYFRGIVVVGSILYVFSLFMVSIADPTKYYQVFLSQGLGMGIGGGLVYVPAVAIQGHHWRARRALAMGLVVCGSSVGGIIFPIMLNKLFNGSAGFKWGVRASAFLALGLLILSNLLMRPQPSVQAGKAPKADMKVILTDVPYLLANVATLLISWGLFFPYFYLQLFATLHKVDANAAFYMLAIMNAASIPGRVLPNHLADRVGPFNVIVPVSAACTALLFGLWGVNGVASTIVFAILFGFFSGAYLSLCAPCVASLARYPSEIGARFGLGYTISAYGALTGNPIAGALLGNSNPIVAASLGIELAWWKPILFCSLASAASILGLFIARNMIAARKGTHWV